MANRFYWKGQQKHVRQYIRECPICQQNKSENTRTPGLLQPLPIPTAPFIDISMDFVEGFPKSEGREVIFVVVDRFSKYAHFMAIPHPYTACSVARVFLDNVYKLHGFPATIVSDRDTVFLSLFWKELFARQGVKLCYSTAYHPQSDGQTEVVNKCLENYMRCMKGTSPTRWVQWLPLAEWWYNTNYHTATKSTPYEILYGYPPFLHIPYFPKDSPVDAVNNFLCKREQILHAVKKNLQNARHRMIQLANKHRSERQLAIGDLVYLKLQPYKQKTLGRRHSKKLASKYYGPYEVLARIGIVAYKLKLPISTSIHPVFHVSLLKKKVGNREVHPTLPDLPSEPLLLPQAILDRRMVKKNLQAATQLLVHWAGLTLAEATWEFADELALRFPQFDLEDKVYLKEGQLLQGSN